MQKKSVVDFFYYHCSRKVGVEKGTRIQLSSPNTAKCSKS